MQPTAAVEPTDAIQPSTSMNLANAVLGMTMGERDSLVPTVNKEYVPWGHYEDIHRLLSCNDFFTIYITGMSGNGKTTMIEQICANLDRECYRVNIIATTDEDDLIGGMRLINGDTVWQDGPVVEAMKRGAVLLLDEIDLGTERMMCLQSVLEGKGVYIKKQNVWVTPAKGFCVVATANTKGKGSDDGRFIGTQVLNEAFLDRFDYTYEQDYAPKSTEKKIIVKAMKKYGIEDNDFATSLVDWADITRDSFKKGAVSEIISTRRLLNIVKAYSVFKDKIKSVKMSLARFDKSTQDGLFSLYSKVDGTLFPQAPAAVETPAAVDPMQPPF
jgi:midasin (ATPase involved in ribosome maturation)